MMKNTFDESLESILYVINSLSNNYHLYLYSMMNVCLNVEGHIHKVLTHNV